MELHARLDLALILALITESVSRANAYAKKALKALIVQFPFVPMIAQITEFAVETLFISALVTKASLEKIAV